MPAYEEPPVLPGGSFLCLCVENKARKTFLPNLYLVMKRCIQYNKITQKLGRGEKIEKEKGNEIYELF